jgi:hypothetical protein
MQCTCKKKSDYNHKENTDMHRHEEGCALAPDLTGWLRYPHDGGLENGGVYVNPSDTSVIYRLVDGYLCRNPRGVEEAEEWVEEAKWVEEPEFDRYLDPSSTVSGILF